MQGFRTIPRRLNDEMIGFSHQLVRLMNIQTRLIGLLVEISNDPHVTMQDVFDELQALSMHVQEEIQMVPLIQAKLPEHEKNERLVVQQVQILHTVPL